MNHHDIDHLPIVDEQGVLQDLLLRRDLVGEMKLRRMHPNSWRR